MEQATIECVDPKQGQLKLPVKYETSSTPGKGRINLILPNKTLQYQVAYDVKINAAWGFIFSDNFTFDEIFISLFVIWKPCSICPVWNSLPNAY